MDQIREGLEARVSAFETPPQDLGSVVKGGRRRRRLRRARIALGAMLAGAAIVGAGMSWPWASESLSTTPPAQGGRGGDGAELDSGWQEFTDPEGRFVLSYPPGWTRAVRSLTPNLEDPEEILTVSTFDELAPRGDRCVQVPGNALEAMRPTDALVSVYEREQSYSGDPRPDEFTLNHGYDPEEFDDCLSDQTVIRDRWISFSEGDRYFHAYVALGQDASASTEAEALEILDRLVLP